MSADTSPYELVIKASKDIESMLENHWQATGRGLHEKLNSIEQHLPNSLISQIRRIATIRNQLVHNVDFELDDTANFEASYQQAKMELLGLAQSNQSMAPPQQDSVQGRYGQIILALIPLFLIGLIWIYLFQPRDSDTFFNRFMNGFAPSSGTAGGNDEIKSAISDIMQDSNNLRDSVEKQVIKFNTELDRMVNEELKENLKGTEASIEAIKKELQANSTDNPSLHRELRDIEKLTETITESP